MRLDASASAKLQIKKKPPRELKGLNRYAYDRRHHTGTKPDERRSERRKHKYALCHDKGIDKTENDAPHLHDFDTRALHVLHARGGFFV